MSRIRFLGATSAVLLSTVGMAVAADVSRYPPPPPTAAPLTYYTPPPSFTWSGPYLGVTGGYGLGGSTIEHDGWIGGAYVGANYQPSSNLVVGLEGDFTLTGKEGTGGTTTVSNPWNATMRGRLGFAMDRFMVYGTGGVAAGKVDVADTVGPTSETATLWGWTAGGGLEAALTDHVIGRVEYRHTNLGSATFDPGTFAFNSNDVMGGLGLKF
jgi:outer membrane immunogenic protein